MHLISKLEMKTIQELERKLAKILNIVHQDILGVGLEFYYKELPKISNVATSETVEIEKYNEDSILENKIDWTSIYGEIGERKISIYIYSK